MQWPQSVTAFIEAFSGPRSRVPSSSSLHPSGKSKHMSASQDQDYESVLLVVRECYGKCDTRIKTVIHESCTPLSPSILSIIS